MVGQKTSFMDYLAIGLIALITGSGLYIAYNFSSILSAKQENIRFERANDKIVLDLKGKSVPTQYNQIWYFADNQNISINVLGQKQYDDRVALLVELSSLADLDAPKDNKVPNLPKKVRLKGLMKITYESFSNEWYVVGLENVNLLAVPEN